MVIFFQQGELDVPITDLSVGVCLWLETLASSLGFPSHAAFEKSVTKVQGWLNERKVLCVRVYHVISLV